MSGQLSLCDAITYTNQVMTTSFGDKFKNHRKARGFSIFRLSQVLGMSEGNLCAIEKNRRPASEAVLRRIAEIPELGITYQQLRAWQILTDASPDELDFISSEVEEMKKALRRPNSKGPNPGAFLL